jgi:hypothetical protein
MFLQWAFSITTSGPVGGTSDLSKVTYRESVRSKCGATLTAVRRSRSRERRNELWSDTKVIGTPSAGSQSAVSCIAVIQA